MQRPEIERQLLNSAALDSQNHSPAITPDNGVQAADLHLTTLRCTTAIVDGALRR
jgi:hypothetical protein